MAGAAWRRGLPVAAGAALLAVFLPGNPGHATSTATRTARATRRTPNPIVQENTLPGTTAWIATPQAPDGTIKGYAEPSLLPDSTAHFHVSTSPSARYRVRVFRLGWYGGAGAHLVACLPSCTGDEAGAAQPIPRPDGNGEVRAGWPVTDTLQVAGDWVSGYYLAQFVLTSGPHAGQAARTPFVVRPAPGRSSRMLVQVPVNTWQAYNGWGGKSLYDFSSTHRRPANRVSFERPYAVHLPGAQEASGWEIPLVRWLEREGYDVSYQADGDTSFDPGSLLRHRLVLTAGHGEYWTKDMRDAFDAARDRGTNLAFMGANTAYWQVRYENGGETMVGYKSVYDPEPDPALKTAMFRELIPPRYECELLGIQHQGVGLHWDPGDYTVQDGALGDRWLAGTGFKHGSVVLDVVSTEADTIPGNQTAQSSCGNALTVFFHRERGDDKDGNADAVRYVAPSGARVFSSGSHQFAWGLDGFDTTTGGSRVLVDPRLQAFMRNALDDLQRPAPPTNVNARRRARGVRIVVTWHPDPRVRGVVVTRRGAVVCRTRGSVCIDRKRGKGRYAAVTFDAWGRSTPTLSNRIG